MRIFIAIVVSFLSAFIGWIIPRLDDAAIEISPIEHHRDVGTTAAAGATVGVTSDARGSTSLSDYAEIEQRMLFSPTRRPPKPIASKSVPEAPVAAVPAIDFGQFQLLGTLLHPGHKRALIRTPKNPDGRWIAEGGSLNGVAIRSISADQVTLDAAGVTGAIKVRR